jgi:hypothetical protein
MARNAFNIDRDADRRLIRQNAIKAQMTRSRVAIPAVGEEGRER